MKQKTTTKTKRQYNKTTTDISKLSPELCNSHLEIGKSYTYQNLCYALGITAFRTKRERTSHINTLQRFMKLQSIEDIYVVLDIYDTIQPPIPKKTRKDSVFTKYIQLLLLSKLNQTEGYSISKTNMQWWLELKMIAPTYIKGKYSGDTRNYLINLNKAENSEEELENFYDRTSERMRCILRDAFKMLRKRRFIDYTSEYIVGTEDKTHIASDKEISIWLKAERKAIKDLSTWSKQKHYKYTFTDITDIIFRPQFVKDKFREFCNIRMKEVGGWDITYKKIKVIFTQYGMEQEIKTTAKEIEKAGLTLNTNVLTAINRDLIKKNFPEEVLQDFDTFYGTDFLDNEIVKSNPNIHYQAILAEKTIRIQ